MADLPVYVRIVAYFRNQQKKHGVSEVGNRIQNQWNMKTVLEDMEGNEKELHQLITFYFLTSDHKTFYDFFKNYHGYLDSMRRVKADRKARAVLRKQTLER